MSEEKRKSLQDILNEQVKELAVLDEIPDDEFTEQKLAEIQLDVRAKIDGIKHKLLDWERTADMYNDEYIKPWVKARAALLKKVERLENYVQREMADKGYEKLPGNFWRVQFQNTAKHLRFKLEPSPQLYLNPNYRDYLVQNVTYNWNQEAVKEAVEGGTLPEVAELSHTRYIRFYPNKKNEAEK